MKKLIEELKTKMRKLANVQHQLACAKEEQARSKATAYLAEFKQGGKHYVANHAVALKEDVQACNSIVRKTEQEAALLRADITALEYQLNLGVQPEEPKDNFCEECRESGANGFCVNCFDEAFTVLVEQA